MSTVKDCFIVSGWNCGLKVSTSHVILLVLANAWHGTCPFLEDNDNDNDDPQGTQCRILGTKWCCCYGQSLAFLWLSLPFPPLFTFLTVLSTHILLLLQ